MATGEFGVQDQFRNQQVNVTAIAAEIGAASATGGAATLNAHIGKITSESITTAQNANYTLTLTNNKVVAGDIVLFSVANGTNTQGTVTPLRAVCGASSIVFVIANKHSTSEAFNGTIVVSYMVVKALTAGVPSF